MPPKMTAADKALKRSEARKEFRKELIQAGAASDVIRTRERGRQRRSVEKVKTQQRVIERQQSEAARIQSQQVKSQLAIQQRQAARAERVGTQSDLYGLRRREAVVSSATGAVTGSSIWSTVTLITTLFFVMILLYVIVTNGVKFGNLAGSVGTFIAGLSSNQPLFVRKEAA